MSEEKFTPKTLAEFWANVPSEDAKPEFLGESGWKETGGGPNLNSYTNNWRWPPQEKVIDLSCLSGRDVLCLFDDDLEEWSINYLLDIEEKAERTVYLGGRHRRSRCIPALGLWQACDGELPDLPEGLDVTVRAMPLLGMGTAPEDRPLSVTGNIPKLWFYTAYRVNGKLDGYKWPWE